MHCGSASATPLREPSFRFARCRSVTAREYRQARSDRVVQAVFAVILAGWGVTAIIIGAMGWAAGPPAGGSGLAYAAGAGLIAGGGLAARSLRRMTLADETGLRLRGMFGTRVIPRSRIRYIHVRPYGRSQIVEAGLADDSVALPATEGSPGRVRQLAAGISAAIPGEQWLAIGLELTADRAPEAGSHTPLLVTAPLRYRASWELPGPAGAGQAGAPVLCSSAATLAPGDSARAVIIPAPGTHLSEWRLLGQGDRLRLLEGSRTCGQAVVCWLENTSLPVPSTDMDRFRDWARSSDDHPRPA